MKVTGPFTDSELPKILKAEEIYLDDQHYKIASVQFFEKTPDINEVQFKLESVNL